MKTKRIIDTNVPLTANGVSSMSPQCRLNCIEFLEDFIENGFLVLDDGFKIIGEYMNKLPTSDDDVVGDVFLEWVLTNKNNPAKVEMVKITPTKEKNKVWFDEIPEGIGLDDFDPSDLKFIAVAFKHPEKPPIAIAADCKWIGIKDVLSNKGLQAIFLCEEELEEIWERKINLKLK